MNSLFQVRTFVSILILLAITSPFFSLSSSLVAAVHGDKKMKPIKIAAVQYPVATEESETQFYTQMLDWIKKAKRKHASMIIFPELHVLNLLKRGTKVEEIERLKILAKEFTPRYVEWIQKQAKETGLIILGGTSPRETPTGIRNTAIMAFPDGQIIQQDKLHLTPDEQAWKWTVGDHLKIYDHPLLGKFAINICYDSEIPQVSQLLTNQGLDLLLIPSMTGKKGFNRVRWSAQARAVEHYTYVIVTGTVTNPLAPNDEDVGQAVFIAPQDLGFETYLAEGHLNQPELVVGTVDIKKIQEQRQTTGYHPARDGSRIAIPILDHEIIDCTQFTKKQ